MIAFADIQKIHAESGTTTKQLIREVDRVTERLVTNKGQCVACIGCIEESNCKVECGAIDDCLNKLAEYEAAEEDGRLVVLPASMNGVDTFGKVDGSYWCRIPCNIGDRVYRIVSNYHTRMKTIREVEVSRIAVTNSETQLFTDEIQGKMILGKTVFLTREEAEKALEDMKKGEMINE